MADALPRPLDSSLFNPVLAVDPLLQHEGATTLNRLGVAARIARFIHPHPHLDKPYLLTLTGTARIQLADNNPPSHIADASADARSPPTPDIM